MDAWHRYYPPDVFVTLWDRLDALTWSGDVFVSDQVRIELREKDDDLFRWVDARRHMCRMGTEIQDSVSEILALYPDLIDARAYRDMADPFVIAAARVAGGTVVTAERATRPPSRPKIPNVCDGLGVPWMPVLEFLRRQGWTF